MRGGGERWEVARPTGETVRYGKAGPTTPCSFGILVPVRRLQQQPVPALDVVLVLAIQSCDGPEGRGRSSVVDTAVVESAAAVALTNSNRR